MKFPPTAMGARLLALMGFAVVVAALAGCGSGSFDLAYTGGGVPPGEPDIGGIVVAAADGMDTAQDDQQDQRVPVPGAEVRLIRGRAVVGMATTGDEGFFRFEHPDTGRYTIAVRPPAGSGLSEASRDVQHERGRRTFVEILLQRLGPGGPSGPVH